MAEEIVSFDDFKLSSRTMDRIAEVGFVKPTPVQAAVIPLLLNNKDVLAEVRI
jgi:superfamily II DNA/RNA helicase